MLTSKSFEISLTDLLSESWSFVKNHLGGVVLAVIMYLATILFLNTLFLRLVSWHCPAYISCNAPFRVLLLLFVLSVSLFAVGALLNVFYVAVHHQDNLRLRSAFRPVSCIAKASLAILLVSLVSFLGFLLIVPGVIFMFRLLFVPYVILDNPDVSLSDAFRRSWDITKGHSADILVSLLIAQLVMLAGYLCLLVGALVSTGVVLVMSVKLYEAMSAQFSATTSVLAPSGSHSE